MLFLPIVVRTIWALWLAPTQSSQGSQQAGIWYDFLGAGGLYQGIAVQHVENREACTPRAQIFNKSFEVDRLSRLEMNSYSACLHSETLELSVRELCISEEAG